VGWAPPALSHTKRLEPVNHPAKFNRLTRWSFLADAVPAICTDTQQAPLRLINSCPCIFLGPFAQGDDPCSSSSRLSRFSFLSLS
jgi:hypothetical protein